MHYLLAGHKYWSGLALVALKLSFDSLELETEWGAKFDQKIKDSKQNIGQQHTREVALARTMETTIFNWIIAQL